MNIQKEKPQFENLFRVVMFRGDLADIRLNCLHNQRFPPMQRGCGLLLESFPLHWTR